MALDPISIATGGYACEDGGLSGIPIATDGYVCYRTFTQALAGALTGMFGTLTTLFIPGAGGAARKNGGIALNINIGAD